MDADNRCWWHISTRSPVVWIGILLGPLIAVGCTARDDDRDWSFSATDVRAEADGLEGSTDTEFSPGTDARDWRRHDADAAVDGGDSTDVPHELRLELGRFHSCALLEGEPFCWGYNHNGESSPPSRVFRDLGAGYTHTCGLTQASRVVCWGEEDLGGATREPEGNFRKIDVGHYHSCGLRMNGQIECWGLGTNPDREEDDVQDYDQASPPPGTFTDVACGSIHTCAVRRSGELECWGHDQWGKATPPDGTFVSVSAGATHSCARRADGSVECWGKSGEDAYLDNGQTKPPSGPFESVSAGGGHNCGLRPDGTAACWGLGSNPDPEEYEGRLDVDQAVPPTGTFVEIGAGARHTCGIRPGGAIECWGNDRHGESSPPDELQTEL